MPRIFDLRSDWSRMSMGLRNFIDHVYPHYESRLRFIVIWWSFGKKQPALRRKTGYDSFSTTLLISPYQNHELIIKTAQAMAKKYHVTFLYRDFVRTLRKDRKSQSHGAVYAEILRLYIQRGGPLLQPPEEGAAQAPQGASPPCGGRIGGRLR